MREADLVTFSSRQVPLRMRHFEQTLSAEKIISVADNNIFQNLDMC